MTKEKTLNEVKEEFKTVFGRMEYQAVSVDGKEYKSPGYKQQEKPRLELDARDYIALGRLGAKHAAPSAHAVGGLLGLMVKKKG